MFVVKIKTPPELFGFTFANRLIPAKLLQWPVEIVVPMQPSPSLGGICKSNVKNKPYDFFPACVLELDAQAVYVKVFEFNCAAFLNAGCRLCLGLHRNEKYKNSNYGPHDPVPFHTLYLPVIERVEFKGMHWEVVRVD